MRSLNRLVLLAMFSGAVLGSSPTTAAAQAGGWFCTFGPVCHDGLLPMPGDVTYPIPPAAVNRCQPGFLDQMACARDPNPGFCLGARMTECLKKYCSGLIPHDVDLRLCVMVTVYPPGFLPPA